MQHAVMWPIMLHAMGLKAPHTVFSHGWWLVEGEKMSKSLGNVVNPLDVIDEFGIDVFRYFLLREVPFGLDGVFSKDALIKRFNADLANDLGNLVYRTLTMAEKNFEGRIPRLDESTLDQIGREKLLPLSSGLGSRVNSALESFDFGAALGAIWELIGAANKYVEETKPWNLKKEGKIKELENFIALLILVIRSVAEEIEPFMPQTSAKIKSQIKADHVEKGEPLFPRIINEKK